MVKNPYFFNIPTEIHDIAKKSWLFCNKVKINKNLGFHYIQLVHNIRYDMQRDGIEIVRAGEWLAKLED